MAIQLAFDFAPRHQREQRPILQNEDWLDVSDIARGVGFATAVQVGISLHEALQPLQNEIEGDYGAWAVLASPVRVNMLANYTQAHFEFHPSHNRKEQSHVQSL